MATTSTRHGRHNGSMRRRVMEQEAARQDEIAVYRADATEFMPLGREALEVAKAWAVIGIFLIIGFAVVHHLSLILKPVTLAIVIGMILGMAAERMGEVGIPRFGTALILSTLVMATIFLMINALAEPLATLLQDGPRVLEGAIARITPFLERHHWLNITPATFETGPMSMEKLIENSGNILSIVSGSLTPAIVQGLIFFAALLLFLYGRIRLRRTIIMAFPTRRQRLLAIRISNAIEEVLGYYFATASVMYMGLGVVMTLIAYAGGLSMPILWGIFAFLSSFIPFLGITVMTLSVAIAGIMTHDALLVALLPATVFFLVHLVMENLAFPAVMGRQWEINPFVVFLAILFWTWMWGAVGAMLALPLSLIVMTIAQELFPDRKTMPQLPD
ncbi:Predicted PurR-regulated permease PerM [Rhizobium sp. RU35A]|uniref:AI-2E family transporter n=2 Tax=Rhizobium straminoryzae TaxID=1387186 RepID=A0A549T301_9HYPH|nr:MULTISPECIES: AI-2E family transporter [Rhizobium]TRL36267.1 AI-2E family transporter [Rhizobium straminoryzae]SIP95148.1 Predicted PurR-regulated permease PerM [Rhizobium sp. RU35A]